MKVLIDHKIEPKNNISSSKYFSEIAGIIGGVGPEATNYFISLLIKQRLDDVKKDQDHIPYLAFNNPQIPDRTEYLVEGKEDPLPELVHTATTLKKAGATFLVIPCNSSHPFAKQIEEAVGLKVVNMIELTVKFVRENYGEAATVGLLATNGTIKTQIYHHEFEKNTPNVKVILPSQPTQEKVMKAIYDIKSSSVTELNTQALLDAADELIKNGASVIVLGCTEIPLALTKNKRIFPMVDPMEVLAKEVITRTVTSYVEQQEQSWSLPATQ